MRSPVFVLFGLVLINGLCASSAPEAAGGVTCTPIPPQTTVELAGQTGSPILIAGTTDLGLSAGPDAVLKQYLQTFVALDGARPNCADALDRDLERLEKSMSGAELDRARAEVQRFYKERGRSIRFIDDLK